MSYTLSPEQLYALQKVEEGDNLFITGQGGTGKTTLIQYIIQTAKNKKWNCQVCALTGCAALLLNSNARTLHSWSGIRLAKGENSKIIDSVLRNKKAVSSWKNVKLLIIDEVSMMSQKIFEIIEKIARIIRKSNLPFGGIQVIFTGDFFQLPPVGTIDDIDTQKFCFESPLWEKIFTLENHIELTTMFRQKDPVYQSILSNIRTGDITPEQIKILQKYVNRTYDVEANHGCVPAKLFPIKSRVEQYNQARFQELESQIYDYESIVKTNCKTYIETGKPLSLEDVERRITVAEQEKEIESIYLNTPCMRILSLKKGACVMCTINFDLDQGICNGSLGVIYDFIWKSGIPNPVVKFSNGIMKEITPHFWQSEEYPTIAIGQIPLCLSWAMTIHKIQGATLPMAEMDIGRNIFECGQTYVALSRVKCLDGLYLSGFHPKNIRANDKVKTFYNKIPKVEYEMEEEHQSRPHPEKGGNHTQTPENKNVFSSFAYVPSEDTPVDNNITRKTKKENYYVVKKGWKTGIFLSWNECETQVKNYKNAKYKKFNKLEDANQYWEEEPNEDDDENTTKTLSFHSSISPYNDFPVLSPNHNIENHEIKVIRL